MRTSGRLPLESLLPFLIDVPKPFATAPGQIPFYQGKKPLDWSELFGNPHPVAIEIGFGKGLFLLKESSAQPEVNFFGIEKEHPYTLFTATRLSKCERANVRLVSADARWFISEWVAQGSVRAVHVYFPDPWWKKRHQKRRLLTEEFAAQIARVLVVGGQFHFATDVEDYFAATMPGFRSLAVLTELSPPSESEPQDDMDYLTNFERKFRRQGKPIFRALFEKK